MRRVQVSRRVPRYFGDLEGELRRAIKLAWTGVETAYYADAIDDASMQEEETSAIVKWLANAGKGWWLTVRPTYTRQAMVTLFHRGMSWAHTIPSEDITHGRFPVWPVVEKLLVRIHEKEGHAASH